jgi:hypothetical protein
MMHFAHGIYAFIVILAVFAVLFVIGTIASTARLQLKLRRQAGLTRAEFADAVPTERAGIAEAVFDEYRKESYASSFKLSPETNLRKAFDQGSEDIFEAAKQIAVSQGLRSPTTTEFDIIAENEGFTARNLVDLLASLRNA